MNIRTGTFLKRNLAAIAVAVTAFGVFGSGVASAGGWDYVPRGVGTCANIEMNVLPTGSPGYMISRIRVADAVLCLVNVERTSRGIAPLRRFISLRGSRIRGLSGAANQHALEASARPWWETLDAQGNKRSAHVNPYTGSTPETRIRASLYCYRQTIAAMNENAYEGGGSGYSTARAAVSWWMGSDGHRRTLLDPQYRDTGIAVVYGSANPADAVYNPSATFVETFGTCN